MSCPKKQSCEAAVRFLLYHLLANKNLKSLALPLPVCNIYLSLPRLFSLS